MAAYDLALAKLLDDEDRERRYQVVMDSNGYQALSGINARWFPEDFARIAALPQEARAAAVAQFYFIHFWLPLHLSGINSQPIANDVLSMSVNAGMGTEAKLLQEAVNAVRPGSVTVDGQIGPQTVTEANACDPDALLAAFRSLAESHYKAIAVENPADVQYLNSWLARASG